MKTLFVIFVNFNSGSQLYRGVSKVLKFPSVSGVIVIDNASEDSSLKKLSEIKQKEKLSVIKNKENIGFYKAVNLSIRKALEKKADYIMPLDFDLDFSSDFISSLLKQEADIVAPVLKFKRNKKWILDYGGRINWIIGRSYHLEENKPLNPLSFPKFAGDKSTAQWYDFVSGGCTIIDKNVIKRIGFLDEDYFVYYGDTDYALRAKNAGFKVVIDPNTIVHHRLEITKITNNINKIKIALLDNLVFINKWVKWYYKPIAYSYFILLSLKATYNLLLNKLSSQSNHQISPN